MILIEAVHEIPRSGTVVTVRSDDLRHALTLHAFRGQTGAELKWARLLVCVRSGAYRLLSRPVHGDLRLAVDVPAVHPLA